MNSFIDHTQWNIYNSAPYVVEANRELLQKFASDRIIKGFTITNVGFYAPQGRVLRAQLNDKDLNKKLTSFEYRNHRITNLEMETATMYGLSKLLGHRAVSFNAIVANRATGEFSKDSTSTIDALIQYTLGKLTE